MHAQLLDHVVDMPLDGVKGDAQARRKCSRVVAPGQQPEYVGLLRVRPRKPPREISIRQLDAAYPGILEPS